MRTDLNRFLIITRKINERVAELPPDTPERKEEYENGLASLIKEMAEMEKQEPALLSREKEQPAFTQNDNAHETHTTKNNSIKALPGHSLSGFYLNQSPK